MISQEKIANKEDGSWVWLYILKSYPKYWTLLQYSITLSVQKHNSIGIFLFLKTQEFTALYMSNNIWGKGNKQNFGAYYSDSGSEL